MQSPIPACNHRCNCEEQIRDSYRTTRFQNAVKDALKQDAIVADLWSALSRMHFEAVVDRKIDSKIESNVPAVVKSTLNNVLYGMVQENMNRSLPPMFTTHMNSFLLNNFPQMVRDKVVEFMPHYMANSPLFLEMLERHRSNLETSLATNVNRILTDICNDDHHQVIMKAHADQMSRRGEEAIVQNNRVFEALMIRMQERYNTDFKTLADRLQDNDRLRADLVQCQQTIRYQSEQLKNNTNTINSILQQNKELIADTNSNHKLGIMNTMLIIGGFIAAFTMSRLFK